MRRDVERILSHRKVQKEMPLGLPKKLEEYDSYCDLSRSLAVMSDADNELRKLRRMIADNDGDPEYKKFMLNILRKQDSFIPNKRLRENDDARQRVDDYCGEEGNDPQYERFLKCLRKHGNSYLLKYEKNGKYISFKYEEKVHLYENGDSEPKRKLRSDVNQTIGPSNQRPDVGNRHKHGSQSTEGILRHEARIEEEKEETEEEYQEKVHLDENGDVEPKRKLRSDVNQTIGPSNQMLDVGNQHKHGSQSTEGILRHEARIEVEKEDTEEEAEEEKEENAEYATDKAVPNSDNPTCYTAKVKDEIDASLDRNCDLRPRTRLRSGMKLRSGSSNCMPSLERRHKHDVQSTYKTKNLTGKSTRSKGTIDMVPDPDYLNLLQHFEVINNKFVYTYEGIKIVYEANGEEHVKVKQEHVDESYSDVEILDSNNMNENISNTIPTMTSGFRRQLIKDLKKPYNSKEYDKLWHAIKLQKPQERHLELRRGRDLSCTKHIDGKSYLDHHPGLARKLRQCKNDKPKRLNLLRGFFFWLQNAPSLDKSFVPWNDAEFLAIRPKSF